MKNKAVTKKVLAVIFVAGMTVSMGACAGSDSGNNSGDSGRISSESVVEDNQAAEDTSGTQAEETETESAKRTEYPLTITSYGPDGEEYTTVYEEAPQKVVAVYQGCVETMLALGLEDHLIATAGLDNEVPDDQKAAFSQVDYLFANREEGQQLTEKEEPEEIAEVFLECGAGCAVIKTGKKGCYIKNEKEAFAIPGFSVECVDTTGAGDSFCAGFLYGLSEEKDLYTCGLYGNACGALAVRQVGACREKILWKDVEKLIEEQEKKE